METLFAREWQPHGPTAGGLVLVHGYAEHSGRYEALAAALNNLGIHVFAHDHRGHGRSPGPRGEIRDFPRLVADLHGQAGHAARVCAGKPLFLLGHSMGGLVALHYLASDTCRVAGAILSSPLLALTEDVPAWKIRSAHWLGRFAPWLPVERLDASAISRDPDAVRTYETDPLIYHGAIRAPS